MFRSILVSALFLSSFSASAASYNVQVGQSVDLQTGDVALVRDGNGALSAVTCGGNPTPTLPARQQFQIAREVRFSDLWQTGGDAGREIQCGPGSAEPQIRQAMNDTLNNARETCFNAGYNNCAQPLRYEEQFSFYVRGFPGQYTCQVLARIIGTQPHP